MNGVTIIEEHLCRAVELPSLILTCILITLVCISVLALYRFMYKNGSKSKAIKIAVWCCSVAIVIMCIASWSIKINDYNKTYFEYTIEVDDSVGFNDFFNKYEIISVDGNRYRVTERLSE